MNAEKLKLAVMPIKQKLSNDEFPLVEKLINKTINDLNRIGYYTGKTQFDVANAINDIIHLQEKITQLRMEIETIKCNLMRAD